MNYKIQPKAFNKLQNNSIKNYGKLNILLIIYGLALPLATAFKPRVLPVFLGLMTLTLLINGYKKKNFYSPTILYGGLGCLFLVSSSLWSLEPAITLIKALKVTALALCAYILFRYSAALTKQHIKIFLTAIFVTTVFAAGLVLLDWLTSLSLSHLVTLFRDANQTIFYANVMKPGSSLIAIGLLLLSFYYRTNKFRFGFAIILLSLLLMLHPSIMRTYFFALSCGLIAYSLSACNSKYLPQAYAAIAIIFIGLTPILLLPENFEFLNLTDDNLPSSLLHRLAIWNFAIEKIWEAPLLGHGLGSSAFIEGGKQLVSIDSLPSTYLSLDKLHSMINAGMAELLPLHPHNMGIQMYLELGLVGVIFLSYLIWKILTVSNPTENRYLLLAIILLLAMNQAGFSIWQSWWLAYQILFLFIAYLMAQMTKLSG